jgi:hypothetical protein
MTGSTSCDVPHGHASCEVPCSCGWPSRRVSEVWLAAINPGKTSEYDPMQVHLSIWKVTFTHASH